MHCEFATQHKIHQFLLVSPMIHAYRLRNMRALVGLGVLDIILYGPESMRPHRTQILTWLLILWQLLLPSGAPWLHTVVDGSCCTPSAEQHSETTCCHRHHSHGSHSHAAANCSGSRKSCGDQSPSDPAPHDCSNCAICHAISAPRVLTVLIELPKLVEQTGVIETPQCADPLLGFCLPLQCRAPPVA
jgi:hypothetical protein